MPKSSKPTRKRAAVRKLDKGNVSGAMKGGKRPKKKKFKKKRLRSLKDLRMDAIIENKTKR